MAVIAPRVKEEEKVFILLCACWGVSPVVGVCAYAVCVYGRVFICVCMCVCVRAGSVRVRVPVTGLVPRLPHPLSLAHHAVLFQER